MNLLTLSRTERASLKVNVIKDGKSIFRGVIGAVTMYMSVSDLMYRANIYKNELETEAVIYLQRYREM